VVFNKTTIMSNLPSKTFQQHLEKELQTSKISFKAKAIKTPFQ